MIRKTLLLTCLCLLGLAASGSAKADTIGPGSCTTCYGSSYTLSYTAVDATDYNVFLVIDASGFNHGTNPSLDGLNAVSLKIVKTAADVSAVAIDIPPSPAGFVEEPGNLTSNGCTDTAANGYFCSQYTGTDAGPAVGNTGPAGTDTYTFEWLVTVGAASDWVALDGATVKVLYLKPNGDSAGVTNENITLSPASAAAAPEPSSLMLLGTGIIGVAGALKRRLVA